MRFSWNFNEIPATESVPEIPGITDLRSLGAGSMGQVYRGFDSTGREVAVKLCRRMGREALERFEREAQLLGRFQSEAVVRAHSWGIAEDTAYLVCEFVDGETLDAVAARCANVDARVQLLGKLLETVGVAHREGVIHRDLKPSNVLVTRGGQVKLIDFGVSFGLDQDRLTQTGGLVGTPAYMSPEQFQGAQPSPTSDVWSLGVIGYQLLTERLPYEGSSLPEIVQSWRKPAPPLGDDVPPHVARVLLKALQVTPSKRYPDATSMARALHEPLATRGGPPKTLAGVCLALGAAAGLAGWLMSGGQPTHSDTAQPQQAGVTQGAPSKPAEVSPPPWKPSWPRPWNGQLTQAEKHKLSRLHMSNALAEVEFVRSLAERGEPKSAHLYGLSLVVGRVKDAKRNPQRGFAYLCYSLKAGNLRAAGDLAPMFVTSKNMPEQLRLYGFDAAKDVLQIPEDLEVALALAYLGVQSSNPLRPPRALLRHLVDTHRMAPPTSVSEAFAVVERALLARPGVAELLAGKEPTSAE